MYSIDGKRACFVLAILVVAFVTGQALAEERAALGVLTGAVLEQPTGKRIPNVRVQCGDAEAFTDERGEFRIEGLPARLYTVRAEADGYRPGVVPDVLVSAGRVARIEIELVREPITQLEDVRIEAKRSRPPLRVPNSVSHRTRFEMQSEVGAAWDIQRAFASEPGVTATSDKTNNLVVRGGNPSENQIVVDHIEIPSISHLSWQGETGGAIGIVNLDFVRDATFYTGGFPAIYGGKMSSVLEIRFREGNREKLGGELELSMAGFGGGLEGPIAGGKGSWIASYRKSFLEPLKDSLRFDQGLQSIGYSDAHVKIVFDASERHRLSFVGIRGEDSVDIRWVRNADRANFGGDKTILGANWFAYLGEGLASRVTLSTTRNDYDVKVWQPKETLTYRNRSRETETTLEGVLEIGDDPRQGWEIGGMVRLVDFRHEIESEAWSGFSENEGRIVWLGEQSTDVRHRAFKLAAFLIRNQALGRNVFLNVGLRANRFTLTGATGVDPRIALRWEATPETTLSLSGGLVHQSPTYLELTLNDANLSLKDAVARHLVVGIERRWGDRARLRLEAYRKDYRDLPVFAEEGSLAPSGELVNGGEKRVRGIDLLLERRAGEGPFGSVALSLSKAEAKDLTDVWYPDDFDYRRMVTLSGGLPVAWGWKLSGKWRVVGGRPYTLFPVVQRDDGRYEVLPDAPERNQVRYPDYRRLDLRLDRRLDLGGWGASLFFEVQNVTNRDNVFSRQFDPQTGEFVDALQFPRLVILGVIADF